MNLLVGLVGLVGAQHEIMIIQPSYSHMHGAGRHMATAAILSETQDFSIYLIHDTAANHEFLSNI
jgi:hypothetical protein